MCAQPLEQRTILFSLPCRKVCVDHLYRGVVVGELERTGSAFKTVGEVPNVQLGVTMDRNRNTGQRGGDRCESVPIQAVKYNTAGQHTDFLEEERLPGIQAIAD